MNTFIKRALWGVVIAGGMTLLGTTAASAAETGGEGGILSGTQVEAPMLAPITVTDNAVSILGNSSAEVAPAPTAEPVAEAPAVEATQTDGTNGIVSGTQAIIDAVVPVVVSGNSIAVLGESETMTAEESPAEAPADATSTAPADSSAATTAGDDGVLSGTQGLVAADAPITVTGNAISVLGESAVTEGSSTVEPAAPGATDATGTEGIASGASTDGTDSVLGGSQILAPIAVPVTVGSNAISVLGESAVEGGSATPMAPTSTDALAPVTGGFGGVLGGTQIAAPISLPITVGGNGIAVLGDSAVTGPTPTVDPGVVPGVDPGTDPTVDPVVDPVITPAVNPTATPTVMPGVVSAAAPAAMAAGALAMTGGGGAGMLPLALVALVLGGAGAMLLRRRIS